MFNWGEKKEYEKLSWKNSRMIIIFLCLAKKMEVYYFYFRPIKFSLSKMEKKVKE